MFAIEKPRNLQEKTLNWLKLIANELESGNAEEAGRYVADMILQINGRALLVITPLEAEKAREQAFLAGRAEAVSEYRTKIARLLI